MQVARDSSSLSLRFIGEIQTSICQVPVCINQRRARCDNASSFEYRPEQRKQRQRQQDRQGGGRPRERGSGNSERKLQRSGNSQIFRKRTRSNGVCPWFQTFHGELRFT